jgi:hypothetical protein
MSTTKPIYTDVGLKPGLRDEKPATNLLGCGMAVLQSCGN